MRNVMLGGTLAVCIASQSFAAFNLQITEIWPGNAEGANLTDDWFEVTNLGDMPWTSGDGILFYDDDSADPTTADQLFGITTIAPGESVVFVDGNAGAGGLNLTVWHSVWDGPLTGAGRAIPQVGSYEGAGLGQRGDAVSLFLDINGGTVAAGDVIDIASYPDANASGGASHDSLLNAFSSAAAQAVTTGVNDVGEPSIGTPGFRGVVPEPTASVLLAAAIFAASFRRLDS